VAALEAGAAVSLDVVAALAAVPFAFFPMATRVGFVASKRWECEHSRRWATMAKCARAKR
jgi:hypothetical protein